jgi:hypothetical protein
MFYVIQTLAKGMHRLHIFSTRAQCGLFISYAGQCCLLIEEWQLDDYATARQVAEAYRICIDEMEE